MQLLVFLLLFPPKDMLWLVIMYRVEGPELEEDPPGLFR